MTTLKEPASIDEEIAEVDDADEAKTAEPEGESTAKEKKVKKRSSTTGTRG